MTDDDFIRSFDRSGSCHIWTRRRNAGGYGVVDVRGRSVLVHRHVWQLVNGPIPAGLCVLHTCDNPPCGNAAHLFLGTRADNAADMVAKGRSRNCGLRDGKRGGAGGSPAFGRARHDAFVARVAATRRALGEA